VVCHQQDAFVHQMAMCVKNLKEFQELSCLEKTMLPVQASGTEFVV